ncbi:small nuclear ribonucleoprotein E-like [Aquila chrysaetos chrysaetos]|uniref:small nuclear ribonucleoprotein E-like n=1 Tax=Aquila chrysaetos chrysaetos TaxID=223781 RepID=UPI001B7D3DEF|nr:small nuclear ribonucleoprotein E-like [Aquila chrysaetos chrysaetos]
MAYGGQGQKVQKVMVQPINLIFRYLQNRSRIQVWLYEQVKMRLEGCITGFDEYMNLVPDDAEEIHSKPKPRKQLGTVSFRFVQESQKYLHRNAQHLNERGQNRLNLSFIWCGCKFYGI